MTRANEKDAITRAVDLLNAATFSTSVNGYVLSADQFKQLLATLEDAASDAGEEPETSAPPKRSKKSKA